MQALDFNTGWYVAKEGEAPRSVTLPHDAMIHEQRDPNHVGGSQHGFFPRGISSTQKPLLSQRTGNIRPLPSTLVACTRMQR